MTEVDICNLALDNLGVTNKIESLGDASKEGKACGRWYATVRDVVLRSFPWPFARRVQALSATADTPSLWVYAYDLPDDCLKPRRLVRQGERAALYPPPFELALDSTGSKVVLVTDEPEALLEYTIKCEYPSKVALFPATFVDALAWMLASRLVLPLALDNTLIERADKMYKLVVSEAFAIEISQMQADPQPESELITVRG